MPPPRWPDAHDGAGIGWVALQSRPTSEACPFTDPWMPALPFKLNQEHRRHIPKQKHKGMNRHRSPSTPPAATHNRWQVEAHS